MNYSANETLTPTDECQSFYSNDLSLQSAFYKFWHCFSALNVYTWPVVILGGLLNAAGVFLLLCVHPRTHSAEQLNAFDWIMISQSFNCFLCSVFDLPLSHFNALFQYWPFGWHLCRYWLIFDNSLILNCTSNLVFLAYLRFTCIREPHDYKRGFMYRHVKKVLVLDYVLSFVFYSAFVLATANDASENSGFCYINFSSPFVSVALNMLFWLLPGIFVALITLYTSYLIRQKTKSKKQNQLVNCQTRLAVYIMLYLVLYFSFSPLYIFATLCSTCIPANLINWLYLITYNILVVDGIAIIVMNNKIYSILRKHFLGTCVNTQPSRTIKIVN